MGSRFIEAPEMRFTVCRPSLSSTMSRIVPVGTSLRMINAVKIAPTSSVAQRPREKKR